MADRGGHQLPVGEIIGKFELILFSINLGDKWEEEFVPITALGDVTCERLTSACHDVWTLLPALNPEGHLGEATSLWNLVFADGWTSTDVLGAIPTVAERPVKQSMFLCGEFEEDSSISADADHKIQKREVKRKDAFVKIHVQSSSLMPFAFSVCDSSGLKISRATVSFTDGKPATYFVERAIRQYDRMERARVRAYNIELAVYLVRQRLNAWSTFRTSLPEERELMSKFEGVVLADDARKRLTDMMGSLDTSMDQRPVKWARLLSSWGGARGAQWVSREVLINGRFVL